VLKADGLAAGKGVTIVHDRADAERVLDELFVARALGDAAEIVLVEELLVGRELSVLALCDGERAALLPTARDYKRVHDGDRGPNTGGMGAYSRPADATPELLAPRGVDDIADLATMDPTGGLRIEFVRSGDLDHLQPPVEAALYRVAQESITNAKRHARDATRVRVNVVGELKSVRLIMSDDGERASSSPSGGYGLVGMAERLSLLGGDLEAGPGPDRGWTVEATIPRSGGVA